MRTRVDALLDLRKLDISFRDLSRAFTVPKEWVLFERASILMLGLCTEVDPNMNPIHTVGPYLQQFVLGKDGGGKSQMTNSLRDMAMSVIAMPDKTNRLFDRASRGDVQFNIAGLRESALLLYAAVHQVLFALLAMGLAALAWSLDARGKIAIALIAWIAAALLIVTLAISILRSRALVRRLRDRPRPKS